MGCSYQGETREGAKTTHTDKPVPDDPAVEMETWSEVP